MLIAPNSVVHFLNPLFEVKHGFHGFNKKLHRLKKGWRGFSENTDYTDYFGLRGLVKARIPLILADYTDCFEVKFYLTTECRRVGHRVTQCCIFYKHGFHGFNKKLHRLKKDCSDFLNARITRIVKDGLDCFKVISCLTIEGRRVGHGVTRSCIFYMHGIHGYNKGLRVLFNSTDSMDWSGLHG